MAATFAMTSESKAVAAAEDIGYTDVEVISKNLPWFYCGEGDTARFVVKGTSPNGTEREITVCAGIIKGGTVRSK